MKYYGDFNKGVTISIPFNSNASDGTSITLATNGTLKVYQRGSSSPITAGVTLSEDFVTATGQHLINIDTSNAAYLIGNDFNVSLEAAIIDGKTINVFVGSFSLNRNNSMQIYSGLVASAASLTTASFMTPRAP